LDGDSRNVRNDIARTLTTLLVAKVGNNPSTQQIEQVSRSLILKYPFMKDDLGNGYVSINFVYLCMSIFVLYFMLQKSWVERIVTCLRNRVKQAKRKLRSKGVVADEDGSTPKRQRKSGNNDHLFRRYPAQGGGGGSLDDPRSIEEHCKGMREEMKKASPRDHVLLPLLKSTYEDRRAYIEFDSEADVRSMLEAYPALHRPAAVRSFIPCIRVCLDDNILILDWTRYVTSYELLCSRSKGYLSEAVDHSLRSCYFMLWREKQEERNF
jgi:hypothetical protein